MLGIVNLFQDKNLINIKIILFQRRLIETLEKIKSIRRIAEIIDTKNNCTWNNLYLKESRFIGVLKLRNIWELWFCTFFL